MLLRSPQMATLIKTNSNFIDREHIECLTTRDIVVLDGPSKPGMVKGSGPNKRKAGMSVAEFRKYWAEVHAPMALKLPGLRRYERSETLDELYQFGEPRWDGVAQLWSTTSTRPSAFCSPMSLSRAPGQTAKSLSR